MKKFLFLLIGLALAFTSCQEKKIDCHCYTPMDLSEYFPYSVGDTLIFTSEEGDSIVDVISGELKMFDGDRLCGSYMIINKGIDLKYGYKGLETGFSVREDSTHTQCYGKAWSGEVSFWIQLSGLVALSHYGHAKFDEQSNMVSADFSDTITAASSWGQPVPSDTITIVKGVGIVSFRFVDNSITERNNKTYTLVQ